MNKGAKFCLSCPLNPSSIVGSLENDFDLFIDEWCKNKNKNKKSFQNWKNLIISRIHNKIYAIIQNRNSDSLSYNASF